MIVSSGAASPPPPPPVFVEETNREIVIYPNPSRDEVNIIVPSKGDQSADVSINDIMNRTVKASRHALHDGDNQVKLGTSALPPGLYFVVVRKGNEKVVKRLEIIR